MVLLPALGRVHVYGTEHDDVLTQLVENTIADATTPSETAILKAFLTHIAAVAEER